MPRRKQKNINTQEGSTGQPLPNAPSPDGPTRREAPKPEKKDGKQNPTNKRSPPRVKHEHPKRWTPKGKAVTDRDSIPQSMHAPKGPTSGTLRATNSDNNARNSKPSRRKTARSATRQETPKDSRLGIPSMPSDKSSLHSTSTAPLSGHVVSLPLMITSQRQQHANQSGQHTTNHVPAALYSRTTEPLLPCDVDGVSPSDQLEILQNFSRNTNNYAFSDNIISASQESHTVIQESPGYLLRLQSFVPKQDVLQKNGYVLEPLSKEQLEGKKRCRNCGTAMSKSSHNGKSTESRGAAADKAGENSTGSMGQRDSSYKKQYSNVALGQKLQPGDSKAVTAEQKKTIRCKFHGGVVVKKSWSCCGKHVSSKPCGGTEQHSADHYASGEIERLWQFHVTPISVGDCSEIRRVVAIDCEMGSAMSGDSELIRLTLIDYFSSSTLIDSLVYPDIPMEHYRTKFSGVRRKDMETARRARTCIMGRDNARRAVWKYVGPNTVVVGHSANNDLAALRWIHPAVVDTFHIESSLAEKEKVKSEAEDNHPGNKKQEVGVDVDGKEGEEEEDAAAAAAALAKSPSAPPAPAPSSSKTALQSTDSEPQQSKEGKKKKNKGSGKLSLKTLALTRLDREIQTGGKRGHDSLEDAVAARDLVHWHVASGAIEFSE